MFAMKKGKIILSAITAGMLLTASPFSVKAEEVTVKEVTPVTSIKFAKKKVTVKVGQTKKLAVKKTTGLKIKKFKSSNPKVAVVNKKGVITAKRAGKATITVTTKTGLKAKCVVRVKAVNKKSASSGGSSKRSGGGSGTVYWTPSGSVYHNSRGCRSLARSRTVYSGSVADSGKSRVCRNCG